MLVKSANISYIGMINTLDNGLVTLQRERKPHLAYDNV